jgi:two-component system, OmpR family, phosphate regulon sensor histidine kinase PhoR
LVTDEAASIIHHNHAVTRMLGSARPLLGHTVLSLVRNEALHAAVVDACQKGLAARVELNVEKPLPTLLEVFVSPLGKGLKGSVAVFHDITELRRLEQARKDLVANVSHELRTPVTAIRGYAETLQAGALADAKAAGAMVDVIHRQAKSLSVLLDDLLELARLDATTNTVTTTPVSVEECVRHTLETLEPAAREKQISLTSAVDANDVALAESRGLERALLNLVENALKYTGAGGKVHVATHREDGRLVVSVLDTGIGIQPKHLSRVFERFYRADSDRNRTSGGSGLGLAIVKHLISSMNGQVRVESTPGRGSKFSLVLHSGEETKARAS